MSRIQRVMNIVLGALGIMYSVYMVKNPDEGYSILLIFISASLILYAVRTLWQYIMLGRFLVGGQTIFYKGIIALDFGIFTITLRSIPEQYIILYLLGCYLFKGVIDLMRALEAKHMASSWRLKAFQGILCMTIAISGMFYLKSPDIAVYVYCLDMFCSSAVRIISALRRTAIVCV